MSLNGIQIFAEVMQEMQQARQRLLHSGCEGSVDKRDIRLGQMLQEMKDLVKDEFAKLTLE